MGALSINLVGETDYRWLNQILSVRGRRKLPDELHVTICGTGGDFAVATAIVDLFEELKASGVRVTTLGMGEVVSAAALIFVAGDRRVAYPHAVFGLHEPIVTGIMADPAAVRDAQRESYIAVKQHYNILVQYSKRSEEAWRECLQGRSMRWYTAEEAMGLSIVDAIL